MQGFLGVTPLGYQVKDRHLHVFEEEAESVRTIFDLFIMTKSPTFIVKQLPIMGIFSRKRIAKNGRTFGGTPMDKGSIYKILNNPIYIGKIKHKDNLYDGKHEAIIPMEVWNKAHKILQENDVSQGIQTKRRTKAALTGILKCGGCYSSMTPSYTRKKGGKLYRYYTASNYRKGVCHNCPVRQISAVEIESIVLTQLQSILSTPEMFIKTWNEVAKHDDRLSEIEIREVLTDISSIWKELFPIEQQRLLELMLDKVVLHADYVDVQVRANGLKSLSKMHNR